MDPGELLALHVRVAHWAARHGSADPEALASEVILRYLVADGQGKVLNAGWPWTVAKRLLIDEQRRRAGQVDLTLELPSGLPRLLYASVPEPGALVELEELLRPLTPLQRAVLIEQAEGWDGRETSVRLGIGFEAVKALRKRGLESARRGDRLPPAGPPPANKPWSAADDAMLRAGRAAGMSREAVASALGRTIAAYRNRLVWLGRHGRK